MIRKIIILVLCLSVVFLLIAGCGKESDKQEKAAEKTAETPTAKPTVKPTATPTTEPTAEPTATPTTKPTVEPTVNPTPTPVEMKTEGMEKININFATLEELQTLPGIGEASAQAIIDGRPYKKEEDLLKVKGIGDAKLDDIKKLITTRLDINSATLEELQTLPGIGEATAQAIIDGRPYKKVDDLLNVKGIGDKKLADIRELVEIQPEE